MYSQSHVGDSGSFSTFPGAALRLAQGERDAASLRWLLYLTELGAMSGEVAPIAFRTAALLNEPIEAASHLGPRRDFVAGEPQGKWGG